MKKIHLPVCIDGRASEGLEIYRQAWFESRQFVEKLCEFGKQLRLAGFAVIDFNTKDLPPEFDPYHSGNSHDDLTRYADLVIAVREGNSLGFGEGVLSAMLKYQKPGLEFVASGELNLASVDGYTIETFPLEDIPVMVRQVQDYFARVA
jgi:hypothetical protein